MKNKKRQAFMFFTLIIIGTLFLGLLTANTNVNASTGNVIVHFYSEEWDKPNIYYWNSKPKNVEVKWPGKAMTSEGENWFTYTIPNVSKVNLLFNYDGEQTDDLTRNQSGEYWYKDNKWYTSNPDKKQDVVKAEGNDFRDESIYFLITTRFYDGVQENNVHCWDDKKAGNGDDDPAWRGDFAGLIEKLDYIKALGFSAIWITPVVENGSAYDYHGYHAIDFSKVDPRYETEGATYQDLINAAHKKGMKIIQDVVFNHTCNYGEVNLFKLGEKENCLNKGVANNYSNVKVTDVNNVLDESMVMASNDSNGKFSYPNYAAAMDGTAKGADAQYWARSRAMKSFSNGIYRPKGDMNYDNFQATTGEVAGDCKDLNTEDPRVYNYEIDCYNKYIEMGVDAFRIDTVKHVARLTFNSAFLPAFQEKAKEMGNDNFYMFGEVCSRTNECFNHGTAQVSPFYWTWKETKDYGWNYDSKDGLDNLEKCEQAYNDSASEFNNGQPMKARYSTNALLDGLDYHTPDHSESSGMSVIDYTMHFNFRTASDAFSAAKGEDLYFNDSTYSVTYVQSHDYGPDRGGNNTDMLIFDASPDTWAENFNLQFTFRGIPCVYYGTEFMKNPGQPIDVGPNKPLSETGRGYFGDNIEGDVTATDFSEYTASGTVAKTLSSPLPQQMIRLNQIRRAVPALRKGQYTVDSKYVKGNIAFIRRYTNKEENVDSLALVSITDAATFINIPNGRYIDAVTGDTKEVSNGTLSVEASGKGNMRVYVLDNGSGIKGKIGKDTTYLK